jgi:hypothetical protein
MSKILKTYKCNIGEEKIGAATKKLGFEQHHGKRREFRPGFGS